jgi:putative phosphoesterase
MSNNKIAQNEPELILIIGEVAVPSKVDKINEDIKAILSKKKFNKILCTGNIGDSETLDFFKGIIKNNPNKNLHIVKSRYDENEDNYPENAIVSIGDFNIGLINGYQITPWDDIYSLRTLQKSMDVDMIVSGFINKLRVRSLDSIHYLNPGSLTGAFCPISNESNPSFILMMAEGGLAIVYTYVYNSTSKNFDIHKAEFNKLKIDE